MFAQLLIIIQLLPFCLASYIADFHWLHGYHYIPMTQNRRNFLAAPEGEDSKFSDAIPLQPPAYRVTKSHEIVPLAESDASAPEVISETVSASLIIAPSRDKITKSITDNNG
uniref:Secreted protein n=1 Tax=Setaria digitata TaxID=48799 RepID=A0A915PT17_9BILA